MNYDDYDHGGMDDFSSGALYYDMENMNFCHLMDESVLQKLRTEMNTTNLTSEDCKDYAYDQISGNTSNLDIYYDDITKAKFYILAFVILIGFLFNLMSCVVFLRSPMQKSITVFYFFALACADNIVLLGEFLYWLNTSTWHTQEYLTGVKFMNSSIGTCRFVHFLRYFGRLLSSWLVVAICIERYITIAYPLKISWSSTPLKAKLVIAGLSIICMILSCPTFFMFTIISHGPDDTTCHVMERYESDYQKWIKCIIIGGELCLPSIIVVIFTALIIFRLKKARLRRMQSKEGQKKKAKNRKDNQPTIALLAVSIAFVTLRTPYVIMYPLHVNQYTLFPNSSEITFHGAFEFSYTLAVTNYAVNFLLYIVTGKKFRREFILFLLCKNSKMERSWSRSTRHYSTSSNSTYLRRASNGSTLPTRCEVLSDKSSSQNQETPL